MDEKSFDRGKILAQTRPPGLLIPDPFQCNHQELLNFVTPKAAEMLVQGIQERVFEPPLKEVGWVPHGVYHAPKITAQDREIDWHNGSALNIHRRYRALGRLWNNIYTDHNETKRLIFEDFEVVYSNDTLSNWLSGFQFSKVNDREIRQENDDGIRFMVHNYFGRPSPVMYVVDGDAVIFATKGQRFIRVQEMTMEGDSKRPARVVMQRLKDRELWYLRMSTRGYFGVESRPHHQSTGIVRSVYAGTPREFDGIVRAVDSRRALVRAVDSGSAPGPTLVRSIDSEPALVRAVDSGPALVRGVISGPVIVRSIWPRVQSPATSTVSSKRLRRRVARVRRPGCRRIMILE
jgi:hypothetical protein